MAKVLITWELGGGLGHLVSMLPLLRRLLHSGHRVTVALRDVAGAGRLFRDFDVRYLQAPLKLETNRPTYDPPLTYSHLLHNIGFGDPAELRALCMAWRSIYEHVEPDIVFFDHSPTAILAARGYSFGKAVIGIGFTFPPPQLPVIRPWVPFDADELQRQQDETLRSVNQVTEGFGQPPFAELGRLFKELSKVFLQTYAELDHFGYRPNVQYLGASTASVGGRPDWPRGEGPKLFAYLKHFPGFDDAVSSISQLGLPTIVCCTSLRTQQIRQMEVKFPSMRFVSSPLHMELVCQQCDVGICHGSHGAVIAFLLAGKPILAIPLHLEQSLFSQRLIELGAGLVTRVREPHNVGEGITRLIGNPAHRSAAIAFANRYQHNDPSASVNAICDWIETIV